MSSIPPYSAMPQPQQPSSWQKSVEKRLYGVTTESQEISEDLRKSLLECFDAIIYHSNLLDDVRQAVPTHLKDAKSLRWVCDEDAPCVNDQNSVSHAAVARPPVLSLAIPAPDQGSDKLVEVQLYFEDNELRNLGSVWIRSNVNRLPERLTSYASDLMSQSSSEAITITGDYSDLLNHLKELFPELRYDWKSLDPVNSSWIVLPADNHDLDLKRAVVILGNKLPQGSHKSVKPGVEFILRHWQGIGWSVEEAVPVLVASPCDKPSRAKEATRVPEDQSAQQSKSHPSDTSFLAEGAKLVSEAKWAQQLEASGVVPRVRYLEANEDAGKPLVIMARATCNLFRASECVEDPSSRFIMAKHFIDKLAAFQQPPDSEVGWYSHGDVKLENAVVQVGLGKPVPTSVHLIDLGTAVSQSDWESCCLQLIGSIAQWRSDPAGHLEDLTQAIEHVAQCLRGTKEYMAPEARYLLQQLSSVKYFIGLSMESADQIRARQEFLATSNDHYVRAVVAQAISDGLHKIIKAITNPPDLSKADAWSAGVCLVAFMNHKIAEKAMTKAQKLFGTDNRADAEHLWQCAINEILEKSGDSWDRQWLEKLAEVARGLLKGEPEHRLSLQEASKKLNAIGPYGTMPVTAHKVEENSDYRSTDTSEITVRSAKKFSTHQCHEQLPGPSHFDKLATALTQFITTKKIKCNAFVKGVLVILSFTIVFSWMWLLVRSTDFRASVAAERNRDSSLDETAAMKKVIRNFIKEKIGTELPVDVQTIAGIVVDVVGHVKDLEADSSQHLTLEINPDFKGQP